MRKITFPSYLYLMTFLILALHLPIVFAAEDAGTHVNQGNDYYSKGQYDQAISHYNKALEINPKHAGAYYNRGQAYLNKGQHDQAIADYNKALEIDPKFTEAYNGRGLSYAAKAEYDQALSDYNKALEINSKYAEAYYNKALVYEKLGRKEVIEAYENFIKYASDQYASLVEQTKQRIKELKEKMK